MSEKTEQATPKKQQDSRKKGQVAQSQDIPKLLILITIIEIVVAQVDSSMSNMEQLIQVATSSINQPFDYAIQAVLELCLILALPLLGITIASACLIRISASWLQFGFLFSAESIKPSFNKLNPASQVKNMFSGKKFFELFNSALKAVLLACIFYLIFPDLFPILVKLPFTNLDTAWHVISHIFVSIERSCALALVVIAAFDFGMQKFFHNKSIKMSKDDIKQEYKNSEGDPHMKGHRKALARELATSDAPAAQSKATSDNIDDADVLLVNPTHFAVALYYNPDTTPLPKIIHKGHDSEALALIDQAQEKNIPVIKSIWLARTIYKEKVGSYIPKSTLRYVAKVYQTLNELDPNEANNEIINLPMTD